MITFYTPDSLTFAPRTHSFQQANGLSKDQNENATENKTADFGLQFSLRSFILLVTFFAIVLAFPNVVIYQQPASIDLVVTVFTLFAAAALLVAIMAGGILIAVLLTPAEKNIKKSNMGRCLHLLFICGLAMLPAISLWVHVLLMWKKPRL